VYPEAAEALAVKLLEFADVRPGGVVLGKLFLTQSTGKADIRYGTWIWRIFV
jgi:hypothetical protein